MGYPLNPPALTWQCRRRRFSHLHGRRIFSGSDSTALSWSPAHERRTDPEEAYYSRHRHDRHEEGTNRMGSPPGEREPHQEEPSDKEGKVRGRWDDEQRIQEVPVGACQLESDADCPANMGKRPVARH